MSPLRTVSHLTTALDPGPVGFQSEMFGGPTSKVEVLQAGVPYVGSKLFSPQRESRSCEFPSSACHPAKGGLYGECDLPFLPTSM